MHLFWLVLSGNPLWHMDTSDLFRGEAPFGCADTGCEPFQLVSGGKPRVPVCLATGGCGKLGATQHVALPSPRVFLTEDEQDKLSVSGCSTKSWFFFSRGGGGSEAQLHAVIVAGLWCNVSPLGLVGNKWLSHFPLSLEKVRRLPPGRSSIDTKQNRRKIPGTGMCQNRYFCPLEWSFCARICSVPVDPLLGVPLGRTPKYGAAWVSAPPNQAPGLQPWGTKPYIMATLPITGTQQAPQVRNLNVAGIAKLPQITT